MIFRKETYAGIVIAMVIVAGSFFSGFYVGAQGEPAFGAGVFLSGTSTPAQADFGTFWRVWNLVNEKYVLNNGNSSSTKQLSEQEKVWGATEGFVRALGDPYTTFFNPEQTKMFDDDISGNFEGVGMEIGIKNNTLTVVSPLKDSPAEKAGIRSGDKIAEINGEFAADLSIEQAVKKIRGKKGTTVVLKVVRDGSEPREISIVRDVISVPTIQIEEKSSTVTPDGKVVNKESNLRDGVYVVRIFNFGAQSADTFAKAISSLSKSDSQKLIIDLRGNPGGYLEAAVDMASWFVPEGETIVSERSGAEEREILYESLGYELPANVRNVKIVILMDKGSASASEILAGALQEYGKAVIVGEKSFGKGSVQELVHLPDGSSLKVTIARWYTPKGKSISLSGLEPDIAVSVTEKDLKEGKDPQMARAIQYLNTGK